MIDRKLLNKSAVLLKRCSTDPQIATSMKNQNVSIERTLTDNKINVVETFDLAGVSGSFPGARGDIDQIIALKRSGVHFDLLIVPSIDRFTRAGQGHGARMFWDLEDAAIVTYFVAENLFSDDRMHRIIISFMLDAAQQTVVSNTRASLLGNTNSFLDGRSPHSRVPIYGLDRMYCVEGKDMHRIRPLADGTQLMLNPAGDEVLRRFGKNVKGKMPEHYIKQKNETVRLVPGDPKHVATIQSIFHAVHIERRSFHSIAKQLNDAVPPIPSPRGTEWEGDAIQAIAYNRTYVGILRRGKDTKAIYYKTAQGSPAASDVAVTELREKSGRVQTRARPYEEWLLREDPALRDFLPNEIYAVARPAIEARMRLEGETRPVAPLSKDKHRNSDFFLKYILKSKQGGYPMTGKRSGRHGEKCYYRVARGHRFPKTGGIYNRAINATALNKEMLRVLREVLLNKPDLMNALRRAVEQHARQQLPPDDRPQIEKTLKKKQRQIAATIDSLTGDAEIDRLIEMKLSEYRAEAARLTAALRSAAKPEKPVDIEAAVENLAETLTNFGSELDEKENAIIAEMFGLLIHEMEADLMTKETTVTLALPAWIGEKITGNGMMGLDTVFACRTQNETHHQNALILAEFTCAAKGHRYVCYDCKRVRRAA
jgi:DNA invertase Pin-like site-specific DNA recombinase